MRSTNRKLRITNWELTLLDLVWRDMRDAKQRRTIEERTSLDKSAQQDRVVQHGDIAGTLARCALQSRLYFNTDLAYMKEKRGEDTIAWFECLSSITEAAAVHLGVSEDVVMKMWVEYRDTTWWMLQKGWSTKKEVGLEPLNGPSEKEMQEDPGNLCRLY